MLIKQKLLFKKRSVNKFKVRFPRTGSPTLTLLRLHQNNSWILNTFYKLVLQLISKHLFLYKKAKLNTKNIFKFKELYRCDGRYVQDLGTNSPSLDDGRLLFIPTSCFRVTENNRNWDNFLRFASIFINATYWCYHCNTRIAQLIRAMKTWSRPLFHPIYHRRYSLSTSI